MRIVIAGQTYYPAANGQAVFSVHLAEGLVQRPSLEGLPAADMNHLSGDMRRAYGLLFSEWISYLAHLREDYPYLFSLAVRTNPFRPDASAVVRV